MSQSLHRLPATPLSTSDAHLALFFCGGLQCPASGSHRLIGRFVFFRPNKEFVKWLGKQFDLSFFLKKKSMLSNFVTRNLSCFIFLFLPQSQVWTKETFQKRGTNQTDMFGCLLRQVKSVDQSCSVFHSHECTCRYKLNLPSHKTQRTCTCTILYHSGSQTYLLGLYTLAATQPNVMDLPGWRSSLHVME